MSNKELDELNWDVKEYIKTGIEAAITQLPYIESQLENASAKFHISRLNALKIQVLSISNEMFADVDRVVKESMKKVYSDTCYKTAFNIQNAIGIYSDFARIDDNLLEKILSKPWAEDGSNFSERIWGKYRPKLVNRLHKDLIDCVSRGRNPNEYTQAIAKDFNVSLKQAGDLILSEYNYFNERATQDCLNELDVEEYEILGTLDGVTCATCGGLDGKHYPLKDAVIGINSPPFHPRCRCTTIPYFNDEFTQNEERAYSGEDGKTHYTKAKTYEEWKKEFVNNNKFTSANNDDIINLGTVKASGDKLSPLKPEYIPENIQNYLNSLQKAGDSLALDSCPTIKDLSLLSRQTGVEFAVVTVNGKNILIRGTSSATIIPPTLFEELEKNKGVLNYHSHPYIGDIIPSEADLSVAKMMYWQDEFEIVSVDGITSVYNKNGIIETGTVENIILETDKSLFEELFKELI